jgi:L-ascorbate metabolism protein UlaG (beta-lactamase superfamily)
MQWRIHELEILCGQAPSQVFLVDSYAMPQISPDHGHGKHLDHKRKKIHHVPIRIDHLSYLAESNGCASESCSNFDPGHTKINSRNLQ